MSGLIALTIIATLLVAYERDCLFEMLLAYTAFFTFLLLEVYS